MAEADVSLRDKAQENNVADQATAENETDADMQSPESPQQDAQEDANEEEKLEDVQLEEKSPEDDAQADTQETSAETEEQSTEDSIKVPERNDDDVSPGTVPEDQTTRQDDSEQPEPAPERPRIVIETSTGDPQSPTFDLRQRSDSRSTVATQATHRSTPLSSTVFVVNALDSIGQSKEAKRTPELQDAVNRALENIRQTEHHHIDPEVIFRPLQLASKTFSIPLQVTALDCIGKLITYSYFAFPSSQHAGKQEEEAPLIERAIETICDCFENESTPVEIQQQIIKSLLAAVLNDKIVVHGAGLLKAVRQIYNIFIYSKSSQNQHIAQGSLTQMVGTVYDRVRVRLELREARLREEGSRGDTDSPVQTGDATPVDHDAASEVGSTMVSDQPVSKEPTREKLTLQDFEKNKDDTVVNDTAPTMVTRAKAGRRTSRSFSGEYTEPNVDEEDEIYVKDAFLVFRALCKLSQKILSHEQQQDIKSQNMRSKLLSLHLMQHLLNNHISVFVSPVATIKNSSSSGETTMTLLQAIKPHLCLSLSRNGASAVPRVFEVCCEIFWLMLKHMRVMLKKELEVFFKEIYLAILEKRSSPVFQKRMFMQVLEKLAGDPRALVEVYLNYDCDRTALENLFQR